MESQIKVRDFSKVSVSIMPAEHGTWSKAREEMLTEANRPLKAEMEIKLAACNDDDEKKQIRATFEKRFSEVESDLDHKPMEFHLSLGVNYNFLSK